MRRQRLLHCRLADNAQAFIRISRFVGDFDADRSTGIGRFPQPLHLGFRCRHAGLELIQPDLLAVKRSAQRQHDFGHTLIGDLVQGEQQTGQDLRAVCFGIRCQFTELLNQLLFQVFNAKIRQALGYALRVFSAASAIASSSTFVSLACSATLPSFSAPRSQVPEAALKWS